MKSFFKALAGIAIVVVGAYVAIKADSSDQPDATPRAYGYPRLQLYDTAYCRAEGVPMNFSVNSAAVCSTDSGGRWLTVDYPLYGAKMYVTFTRANSSAELQQIIANRRERISLNLGGNDSRSYRRVSPGGFDGMLVVGPGTPTPVQFITTDGSHWAISGSVHLAEHEPYDSIRPIVQAIAHDVDHAMTSVAHD